MEAQVALLVVLQLRLVVEVLAEQQVAEQVLLAQQVRLLLVVQVVVAVLVMAQEQAVQGAQEDFPEVVVVEVVLVQQQAVLVEMVRLVV
jgi:hypothetical protein